MKPSGCCLESFPSILLQSLPKRSWFNRPFPLPGFSILWLLWRSFPHQAEENTRNWGGSCVRSSWKQQCRVCPIWRPPCVTRTPQIAADTPGGVQVVLLLPEGADGFSKSLKWPFLCHNEACPPPPAHNGASQRCNRRKTDEGSMEGWMDGSARPRLQGRPRGLCSHINSPYLTFQDLQPKKLRGGDYSVKFLCV